MDTRVGEKTGEKYSFNFRSLEQNPYGGGTAAGGDDPFAVVGEDPSVKLQRDLDSVVKQLSDLTKLVKVGQNEAVPADAV